VKPSSAWVSRLVKSRGVSGRSVLSPSPFPDRRGTSPAFDSAGISQLNLARFDRLLAR